MLVIKLVNNVGYKVGWLYSWLIMFVIKLVNNVG